MTLSAHLPESPLRREITRLRNLLNRLLNAALNRVLHLTAEQSHARRNLIAILFVLTGVLFTYIAYPASDWRGYARNFFQALFSNPGALSSAATELGKFIGRAVTDPQTLRYLPIFILPYSLAIFYASRYLADIFELKDLSVARNFLHEVTLGGSNSKLVVRKGNISEEDMNNSPLVLIGGPGEMSVSLDSAILVERPNGRPRIIGPTADEEDDKRGPENIYDPTLILDSDSDENASTEPKAKKKHKGDKSTAILEGFERIRFDGEMAGIHLIDQFADGIEVSARTKDGIPIRATDIRFLFHILRDKDGSVAQSTQSNPYPFA